jgi:hypothetical protein
MYSTVPVRRVELGLIAIALSNTDIRSEIKGREHESCPVVASRHFSSGQATLSALINIGTAVYLRTGHTAHETPHPFQPRHSYTSSRRMREDLLPSGMRT